MDLKPCPACSRQTAYDNDVCPYCGQTFDQPAGGSPTAMRASRHKADRTDLRNPVLAAACAFLFPGWGQWYNGRTAEGIYVIAASFGIVIVSAMLMFVLSSSRMITMAVAGVTGLLLLVIWLYSITTAYNTARGINRGGTPFKGKSLLFWMPATLWVLLAGIIVISFASISIPGLPGAEIPATLYRAMGFIPLQAIGF
jgi:TM2 domain-containing membrane protein YozV